MTVTPAKGACVGRPHGARGRCTPPPMKVLYQEPPEMPDDPPPPKLQTPVHMEEPLDGTPRTPVRMGGQMDGTPERPRTPALPLPDIEMLTPTPGWKHRRIRPPPPFTCQPRSRDMHCLPSSPRPQHRNKRGA